MPIMKRTAVAAILLSVAGLVQAQDTLSGTWEGETRGGASIVLALTVTGTALTGTLERNGQRTALADGQVSENRFTFKATLNDQTEGFSGERAGDEIKIWLDRQGASTAIVLRRAARKSAGLIPGGAPSAPAS